ncbi:MAG TPA: hypothetical protein VF368_09195 [Gemmatimonadaceae bacterium]
MTPHEKTVESISSSDHDMVLASLERGQLAGLKRRPIARRRLTGLTRLVVWALRLYLIFMTVVVLYQVWISQHRQ